MGISTRKARAVVAAHAAKQQLLDYHARTAPLSLTDRLDIESEYTQAVRSDHTPTIERATRMFLGGLALSRIWGARAAAIRLAAIRALIVVDDRGSSVMALICRDRVAKSPTLPPPTAIAALSMSTLTAAPPSAWSTKYPAGAAA